MRPAGPAPITAMRSPCGGVGVGEHRLAPGRAIDHAGDAGAAAHAVDAGVAGEAAPDRLAARAASRPIADRRPACGRARRNRPCRSPPRASRSRRIAEPADRDHRHVDRLLDVGGEVEEGRVGIRHRRDHAVRGRLRAVVPGGDMQRVGAGLAPPRSRCAAFAVGQPAVEIILDRQPVDHAELGHRRLHRAQHVEAEARAVLQRAAVFVGAAVLERRVELRDQIAVRGVDFDAVEAGLLRARCAAAT